MELKSTNIEKGKRVSIQDTLKQKIRQMTEENTHKLGDWSD